MTFLTSLAILVLLDANRREMLGASATGSARGLSPWFLGGLIAGFGTLVRPETPLLLAATGLVLAMRWWRPRDWKKLARAGVLMAAGLALPLVPWARAQLAHAA